VRIVDIRERTVAISRHADPEIPSGGLTTSIVAVVTDAVRYGRPVVGYGFSSFGRFGQAGLINERFAPRLLSASPSDLADRQGDNLDPRRAWSVMMAGEKPGGHGERCVAVGTLDMALWDAAAKLAGLPLWRFIAQTVGTVPAPDGRVLLYASGGYPYPSDDLVRLADEVRALLGHGYTRLKIKIGAAPPAVDLERIEAVLRLLHAGDRLAVDAMNAYRPEQCLAMAAALRRFGLWWLEDICDPLDLDTWRAAAAVYEPPIAAGEALFSLAEAKLLHRHAGLRPARDILVFDPVHCYGITHYIEIVDALTAAGWPRTAFWPHGGHLLSLQVTAALGLGGTEVNALSFQPFGGLPDGARITDGTAMPPDAPGIGLETRAALMALIRNSVG
jgi:L-alanine-DL-glutamate epimerase-like enolase superfamily enzyme